MARPTQEHILISDIQDGVVLLHDGSASLVLQTSAVNFGLLSQEEQLAIISAFAQMLNSLSFAIQIVIQSKRLDISSYIHLLDQAIIIQTNPLLSSIIGRYRNFVQSLIKDREVLDKRFYVVINVSSLELGLGLKGEDKLKKIKATLGPRRDQIIRQLSRVGLRTSQLDDKRLIKLFYEIYNRPLNEPVSINLNTIAVKPSTLPLPAQTVQAAAPPQPKPAPISTERPRNHPFVVEELTDSI